MTFPETARVIYATNPLEQVICQLRFPTILEISTAPPTNFQNTIRQEYPLYETERSAGIQIDSPLPKEMAELLSRLPIARAANNPVHTFSTPDSNRQIALNSEFVALTEHHYTEWGNFWAELQRAKTAVEEIYQPAFYTRIGLRYVNVINKAAIGLQDEPWTALLQPHMLGIMAQDGVGKHVTHNFTEATLDLDEVKGGIATMRFGRAEDETTKSPVYFIDTDFYITERTNRADVQSILQRFNSISGNLFRWAITPRLHDALQEHGAV